MYTFSFSFIALFFKFVFMRTSTVPGPRPTAWAACQSSARPVQAVLVHEPDVHRFAKPASRTLV